MRVFLGKELGSLDQFGLTDIDRPEPGPEEVRVRVRAVGLGYVDGLIALGRYQVKPALPYTPGGEIAGIIDAVGANVRGFMPGDRVAAWVLGGGLADYCLTPQCGLHHIPDNLSFDKAAALLVNYATALHGLNDRAGLRPGETLLVLGASGGVGTAAVEVGKRLGARVIACASTPEKRRHAQELGADAAIGTDLDGWRDAIRQLTDRHGVDVVFDPVGGDLFEPAFRSLAWGGRHLVIGFAGGPIRALPANLPLLKGASLVGVDIRQFTNLSPSVAAANLSQLLDWAASGLISVPIGRSFLLESAAEALAATLERRTMGKIVVSTGGH